MKVADTIARLPPLNQRLLALGLVVIAAALLWYALVEPVRWVVRSQSSWRHDVARLLGTDQGWVDSADAVAAQRKYVQDAAVWKQFYPSSSRQDFSDALRRNASALVSAAGASVERAEVLPVENGDGLKRAAVQIGATLTIEQLKNVLTAIKGHQPYFRVQQIHITAPQMQPRDANAALSVVLDIVAYSGELDPALKEQP